MSNDTIAADSTFLGSERIRIIVSATVGTVLFVSLALAAPYVGVGEARYWCLVAASLGFVIVAFACGAVASVYGRWILAGLFLCMAGDVLGPYDFAVGAIMFLLAHVLFVVAFWAHGLNLRHCALSLVMLVPSGLLLNWLLPQVEPSMQWLIIAYTVVITVMVVTAAGTQRLIMLGALVFYVSDIFVARWRFVDQDAVNALICYPLYYTACLLLALSTRKVREKPVKHQ